MPDDSTTPDLEELAQRLEDAFSAGDDHEALKAMGLDLFRSLYAAWERGGYDDGINADLDVVMSLHADDAVYDMSAMGLGVLEGQAAIRGLYEDWRSSYEAFEAELEELRDLGRGVTFSVVVNRGRLHGSAHWIELRYASVGIWAGGRLERGMGYTDIDEARAAAERLASGARLGGRPDHRTRLIGDQRAIGSSEKPIKWVDHAQGWQGIQPASSPEVAQGGARVCLACGISA